MTRGVLQEKSFVFSLEIICTYKKISSEKKEFVLSKQLLRAGTSIGANIEESFGAQSRADFLNKLSISYKEAREAKYWIRLLKESSYLDEAVAKELLLKVEELLRIMGATIKKLRS